MRTPIINSVLLSLSLFSVAPIFAIDTANEEKTCSDIGFKKKTEAHAKCILELLDRQSKSIQLQESNDPDEAICRKYGFRPGTESYSQCRQKIDLAKQEAARYQLEYAERKRQYDEELKEAKRRREIAANLSLMQIGLGLMGGAYSGSTAHRVMPVAPTPPAPFTSTIYMPGGGIVTCTTTGTVTNCF